MTDSEYKFASYVYQLMKEKRVGKEATSERILMCVMDDIKALDSEVKRMKKDEKAVTKR